MLDDDRARQRIPCGLETSHELPGVSLGSTPTLSVADDLTGVTEVRPGNDVFYGAFQATIGSCALEDAAMSVLVSVIGVHQGSATERSSTSGARFAVGDGRRLGATWTRGTCHIHATTVALGAPRWRRGGRNDGR